MSPEERFEQNDRLVGYVYSKHFYDIESEKEDLISEGRLALWKCCQSFDESLGFAFSTYAYPAIKNQMINYMRALRKHECVISMDSVISEDGEGHSLYLHEAIGQDESNPARTLIALCLVKLPPSQQEIISLLMCGYTQDQIALKLSVSQSSVCRCLKRFRSIILEEMNNDD